MLHRLYNWTMAQAAGPKAPATLGLVSFAESSVFPIPPDVILIPMVISARDRAWWFATICTVASVLGGVFGYFIGSVLYQEVAEPILQLYGYTEHFETFTKWFIEYGWLIVVFFGLTPFPYKVITIASGSVGLSLPIFIFASLFSRGLRFFVVSLLLYYFGPPIRSFIEKRLVLVFTVFVIFLIGGFVVIRYFW